MIELGGELGFKPTERQKEELYSLMSNDLVFDCLDGLCKALLIKQGQAVLKALKECKNKEERLVKVEEVAATSVAIDIFYGYLKGWRNNAIALKKKKQKEKEVKN